MLRYLFYVRVSEKKYICTSTYMASHTHDADPQNSYYYQKVCYNNSRFCPPPPWLIIYSVSDNSPCML